MPDPFAHTVLAVPDVARTLAAYRQLGFTGTPPHLAEGMAAVQQGTTTLFVLQPEHAFRQQYPQASRPLGATATITITGLPNFDHVATRIRAHAEVITDHTDDPSYRVIVFRDLNGYILAISDTPPS
ncbi:VOC family protein [Streptomyces sp. NPDC012794]|uniref:VOC family protein n=1 Tax=Streptomyces sp. NPDC012794 TaxID=3364850 RepID=UPI0036C7DA54